MDGSLNTEVMYLLEIQVPTHACPAICLMEFWPWMGWVRPLAVPYFNGVVEPHLLKKSGDMGSVPATSLSSCRGLFSPGMKLLQVA